MDRACDVGVGLEQSCNGKTKKYRAMGDGCPLRAPTAINKKGQEEEVAGPTVAMYLTRQTGGGGEGARWMRPESRKCRVGGTLSRMHTASKGRSHL